MKSINLAEKLSLFSEHFKPRTVGQFNGHDLILAKAEGSFVWHKHEETDDFFLVLKGRLTIQMREGNVTLGPGEMFVVPKGVEHCPLAEEETHILLIEPTGTANTGNVETAAVRTVAWGIFQWHRAAQQVQISEHKGSAGVRAGRVPFDTILRESDIVSLHCPLTEETRGLIGASDLALMKPTALLINCARGGIVDDHALASALANGEIGGAGLDVLGEEPPRNGNPLLDLTACNLVVTPHTAWVSESALATFSEQLIQNLECFVSGRPQNELTKRLSEGSGSSSPTKMTAHE